MCLFQCRSLSPILWSFVLFCCPLVTRPVTVILCVPVVFSSM